MTWTFLSNHAHVLVCIARDPQVRMSDIAREVEIGERAVHRIISELADSGYLTWRKAGRRNVYEIDLDRPLRHPLEADHRIGDILEPLMRDPSLRVVRDRSGAAAS